MPRFLPAPIRAIQRIMGDTHEAYRRTQSRSQIGAVPTTPTIPEASSASPTLPDAPSGPEQDLRRCAWNGSIGDGILRKIHRERRDAVAVIRTANAIQLSVLTNRLAALEAELAVLVEQPPKAPPSSTVLEIGPSRKGA